MKKLVLLVAVIASVSMFSCTGTQEGSASTDTTAVDTTAAVEADAAAPAVDPAAEAQKTDSVAK